MGPFIGGALISGATSLLGGLFGRKQAKDDLAMQRQLINEQNEYNNPTNIRKRAEEAGFNPLSFIGPGVGLQTQTAQVNSGNYMGAAIADAGMAFAGAMADKAKFAETKKLNDLEMANAKLQNKILQLTLRPKVGGVYAERQSTPTIAAAVGGGNAGNSANGATGQSGAVSDGRGVDGTLRPLPETLSIDPRRGVDNSKITSSSGFMAVDTPYWPFTVYFPTADGDEPLQWYDYPSVALPVAGSFIYHEMNKPAEPRARYRVPGVMAPSQKARVVPTRSDYAITGSPENVARAIASIKAVDPTFDDRSPSQKRADRVRKDFAARFGW